MSIYIHLSIYDNCQHLTLHLVHVALRELVIAKVTIVTVSLANDFVVFISNFPEYHSTMRNKNYNFL